MQPLIIRCSNRRQWHGRRGGPATVAPPPFSIATTSGHGVTASQTEEGGGGGTPATTGRICTRRVCISLCKFIYIFCQNAERTSDAGEVTSSQKLAKSSRTGDKASISARLVVT